jgi:cytochrome c553
MRRFAALALVALTACGGDTSPDRLIQAVADADSPTGELYGARCSSCHAPDGGGLLGSEAPAIANLSATYLARQLRAFRDGVRGGHKDDKTGAVMAGSAAGLSDSEIDDLAAYVAALPTASPAITLKGNTARGRDHYSNICSACHGAKAQGNVALEAPRLAGVDDWYLLAQYEKFRDGTRGSHPDDRWGVQMVRIAPTLEDRNTARDVIAWIATQPAE